MHPIARHSLTTVQIVSIACILIAAYVLLDTWEFVGAVGFSGLLASLYAERALMEEG